MLLVYRLQMRSVSTVLASVHWRKGAESVSEFRFHYPQSTGWSWDNRWQIAWRKKCIFCIHCY